VGALNDVVVTKEEESGGWVEMRELRGTEGCWDESERESTRSVGREDGRTVMPDKTDKCFIVQLMHLVM